MRKTDLPKTTSISKLFSQDINFRDWHFFLRVLTFAVLKNKTRWGFFFKMSLYEDIGKFVLFCLKRSVRKEVKKQISHLTFERNDHWKFLTLFSSYGSLEKINTHFKKSLNYLRDSEFKILIWSKISDSFISNKVIMKLAFCTKKFNELLEFMYFYKEIVNSFEAMRKNQTRGSKAPCILTVIGRIMFWIWLVF